VKRISPATVTFGVMAIVLGLVAAYIVRQALHKEPVVQRPAPPPAPETVPVVFTLNVIPKHTRLTSRDVFISQVPKSMKLPPGTFRGANLVEGRITKEAIPAGKFVREDHLLSYDEALPDLSDRLPPGHRAVTIAVQGADTGGKRLAEGDHIDIAMTVEGTHPDLGEVTTRTLMKNVLIVDAAVSSPIMRTARRAAEAPSSLITVAVMPADANRLIVAQRTGALQATLVSASDVADAAAKQPIDNAVNRRQLLGLKEIPKRYTVEKWTGAEMRVIEMSDDRVQESREASAGRRTVPVANPAVKGGDLGHSDLSGVKEPVIMVSLGEDPVAFTSTTPVPTVTPVPVQ
jgi:pilus assembly protein CpaB